MSKRKKMSEEEKKKKFGDKYNPDFKPAGGGKPQSAKDEKLSGVPWKNDYTFYAPSEQIAKDIASFPYSVLTGAQFTVTSTNGIAASQWSDWRPQGCMALEYCNAQKSTANATQGLNKAATQLYTYLRHVNSGARNYEPADVMMLVLAMRDIYSEYLELARALGVVQYYNFENRYFPELILRALRIDAADLRANIAQYRGRLNLIAQAINSIAIPKYFKAIDRAAYITSNVFADSNSMRGQMYVFRKSLYYTFDTTSSETGTMLTAAWHAKGANTDTFAVRLQVLDSMVQAILLDTDANTISGDVLHAFADSQLYQVAEVPENYMVVPTMDEDILAQIENSLSFGSYFADGIAAPMANSAAAQYNVTQTGGLVNWAPFIGANTGTSNFYPLEVVFNSHKDDVDYRDNLEWSRLIIGAAAEMVTTTTGIRLLQCGLELVFGEYMYSIRGDAVEGVELKQIISPSGTAAVANANVISLMEVEEYDWHPTVYLIRISGSGATAAVSDFRIAADLKKFTFIPRNIVDSVHNAALNAAFYSPDLYNMKR